MTPNSKKIVARMKHLLDELWLIKDFTEWYGLNFEDSFTNKVFKRVEAYLGTDESPSNLGLQDGSDRYSRFHFEIALQRWDFVPIRQAAAELAMNVNSFQSVIGKFHELKDSVLVPTVPEESHTIIRRTFLRDCHKGFKSLQRRIFYDHPTYIERLHSAIKDELGIDVKALVDEADFACGIDKPRPAHKLDCLTDCPIGLGNEVYLETNKPIALAPDCCSILTYTRHQEVLRNHVFGACPSSADLSIYKDL